MVLLISLFVGVTSGVVFLMSDTYMAELVISFLPYLTGIWLLSGVVLLILALVSKRLLASACGWLFFVVSIGSGAWGVSRVYDFYDYDAPMGVRGDAKIFYQNIYLHNTNYRGIYDAIKGFNADLFALVEFNSGHLKHLYGPLTGLGYKHADNGKIWRNDESSDMMASRYFLRPISVYGDGLISSVMEIDGRKIMIHMVHTTSPISQNNFVGRNKWLKKIIESVTKFKNQYPDHAHVLLGDFNVSPWSPYYEEFQENLGAERKNQTRQIPLLMTWRFGLQSHIDHVWTWGVGDVRIDSDRIEGSDHKALKISFDL